MARTAEEVAQSLKDSIEATDATLDTEQGPIPDLMIRPQSGELATASSEAEQLRQLFTLQFPSVITADEIQLALGNYGSAPGAGKKSRVLQYFLRFSRPDRDVIIDAGTLVGNSDGSLQYKVTTATTMFFASADSYYNPSRGAYEIGVLVEATGVGPQYDLPSGRINRLLTPVIGIDTTENRTKARNGFDAETTDSQAARLQTALLGLNQGAPGGIRNKIMNSDSSVVTDVSIVQPFDTEWARIIDGPALDVYMIGEESTSDTFSVTATAGQTQVFLRKRPVNSISSVKINGVVSPISYSLVQDNSPEIGKSLIAADHVVFDAPLLFGDVIELGYEYNAVPENTYNIVYASGVEYLFNTDMLMRSAFKINPVIRGEIRTLPSYSPDEVEAQVLDYIANFFTFTTFQTLVLPDIFKQDLISTVPGIQTFRISEFRRSIGSLSNIEPLTFSKAEISEYNESLVNIKVIR